MTRGPHRSTFFPYTTLFRATTSGWVHGARRVAWAKAGRCRGDVVDRKSTRLNSSHVRISYAVFCLKKKKHGLEFDPVFLRALVGVFFFFFNDTATTEIYTLSLHDALPIIAAEATS